MLFGDGAGAVVLKADSETGILSTHLHADGGKKELLWNPVGVSVGFKPDEPNAGVRVHDDRQRSVQASRSRRWTPWSRKRSRPTAWIATTSTG